MTPRLVIFDVDDVFVDMDDLADRALASVGAALAEHFGKARAARVRARFEAHYDTLRSKLRSGPASDEFEALRAAIERWQSGVLEAGHALKIWSRETMLAVALEREDLPVTAEVVHDVVDRYWRFLRDHSHVFDDARRALERFRVAGVHVHLATNSDGNLRFDGETFRYDSDYAHATKLSRLACVLDAGIEPDDLTIGDPIGKPDPAFYARVLERATAPLGVIDPSTIWAVGDSYADDIAPLFARGVRRGFWLLRRKTPEGPPPDGVTVVRTLDEVGP